MLSDVLPGLAFSNGVNRSVFTPSISRDPVARRTAFKLTADHFARS